jgi:hypothetical protein
VAVLDAARAQVVEGDVVDAERLRFTVHRETEVPRSVKPEMRKLLPLGVLMSKPPLVMMVEPWPAPRW